MDKLTLNFETLNIGVRTSLPGDSQWLKEFLCPPFHIVPATPDFWVESIVDPVRYNQWLATTGSQSRARLHVNDTDIDWALEWPTDEQGHIFYSPEREVFYHVLDNRITLLHQSPSRKRRLVLMRAIREIIMSYTQLSHGRLLHASAFAVNGKAIVISGPKRAGKTSLLTYALHHGETDFVTNDRLLVRNNTTRAHVTGIPTILSLRSGMLDFFPSLKKHIQHKRYRHRYTLAECEGQEETYDEPVQPDKTGISQAQWCSLFDCKTTASLPLAGIVFPKQSGQPGKLSVRPVDREQSAQYLKGGLFNHIHPECLSEVFTKLPLPVDAGNTQTDEKFIDWLSRNVNIFECTVGCDAYEDDEGLQHLINQIQINGN